MDALKKLAEETARKRKALVARGPKVWYGVWGYGLCHLSSTVK